MVAPPHKETLGDRISRIKKDSHMSSSSNWYSKLYTFRCHQERVKQSRAFLCIAALYEKRVLSCAEFMFSLCMCIAVEKTAFLSACTKMGTSAYFRILWDSFHLLLLYLLHVLVTLILISLCTQTSIIMRLHIIQFICFFINKPF